MHILTRTRADVIDVTEDVLGKTKPAEPTEDKLVSAKEQCKLYANDNWV